MWSTNVSEEVTGTCVVQLLDSGNLVLIEERSKQVVWQSFDYPTDTHLPGMKVGLNRKTGFRSFLTSGRSADDPGIGDYSIELNPNGSPQAILYRGTKPYWRSSPWPAKQFVDIRNVSFINNQDEAYVTMDVFDASVICESYGYCGAFGKCDPVVHVRRFECDCLPGYEPKIPWDWNLLMDGSSGCVRKRQESSPVCRHGGGFVEVASVKIPDTSEAVWLGLNMSPMDCELECTRNCSCSAYASIGIPEKGTGCLAWYGELMDTTINMEDGNNIYVRVDALELGSTIKWTGGGREKTVQKFRQGIEEFKNEVMLISKLQHKNLVKLIGCCIQGEEPMLVYEYLPNKSLDSFLFDAKMKPKISDFGLARVFNGDQIQEETDKIVGTLDYYREEEQHVLSRGLLSEHDRIWHLWRENRPMEIVDSSLRESCPPHEVLRCIQIGLLCVQEDALDRPTMSTVVLMLNSETTLPPPGQPAFTLKKSYNSSSSSAKEMGFVLWMWKQLLRLIIAFNPFLKPLGKNDDDLKASKCK
ncbi:hypothetical protein GH714_009702 [Hevea brasiliensis]|uniref:Protein kinase domain-containing protein n=1 Tax=Hevea brasiliensis TaxID=3981 RepID=A0A6A6MAX1_HEVBR|nr:hypothetical protein GH714_009702 [Hevea brasiliensis]